ncbi:arsenic resistance N-acetyltransferase ArsN2 [Fodinibius saliphilus]|uniref:arsenic resistance N-acetyltransferase ArsN2 n=1 Tax=Fodinibius saliphilus TaxID=1920650 RepID=UPI00110985BA|nr:arsenic resistance N-acetyltransferase ArsN2 [Fodinibius saliphilus]
MLPNKLDITKAQKKDLENVKQLLRKCQLPSSDLTKHHMDHFFLLKSGNKIHGSVGLEIFEPYGLLRSLAIKKEMREQGYGKLLVNQIENYGHEQDIKRIYLLTTTAQNFFKKNDYRNINRNRIPQNVKKSKEFSSLCPESAASMVKYFNK